ncbi:MAG: hypothetical protein DMG21_20480 [Acidobacteria bacterium]|nr:MAG: hypothetical protein DMG21_20480 [Acidobacteriota bacterium]
MTPSRPGKIRPVCLVGQNPLALEYLTSLLLKESSIQILPVEGLEFGTDLEFGKGKDGQAVVVVVDKSGLPMPLSEGVPRFRDRHPDAKLLVLYHESSRSNLLRLLRLKIDGFVAYGEVPMTLVKAIHSVADGHVWFPREVLSDYVKGEGEGEGEGEGGRPRKDSSSPEAMTFRETQISDLAKRRLSNKEIADILHIQESTVKFHLTSIYSKLQIGTRYDLIRTNPVLPSLGTLPFQAQRLASRPRGPTGPCKCAAQPPPRPRT